MARFRFHHNGFLKMEDGSIATFRIGEQNVPDEIAGDPFLREIGARIDAGAADAETSGAEEPSTSVADRDEKAHLQDEATTLGIVVDRRWGIARLKAEIAAYTAGPQSPAAAILKDAHDRSAGADASVPPSV